MSSSLCVAQVVGGRFRLLREIGRGAAGTVWHVRNEATDGEFALKVLHSDGCQDALALHRFAQEARAAGRLRHPNVVDVYDTGVLDDGTPYQVMQLLNGESLAARLRRERTLPLRDALLVARDVARALGAAHRVRVVHRDVKPENVFLSGPSAAPTVKLLDFGVSKLEDTRLDPFATSQGALLGSPAYMSPEQIESASQVDGRSDVWAVGVLLYRCLAGRVPFPQTNLRALALAVASQSPPLLAAARADLPPSVVAIVERCLAKEAGCRFQDADALADALEQALGAKHAPPGRKRARLYAMGSLLAACLIALAMAGHPSREALEPDEGAPLPVLEPLVGPSSIVRMSPLGSTEHAPPRRTARTKPSHREPQPLTPNAPHEGVVQPGF